MTSPPGKRRLATWLIVCVLASSPAQALADEVVIAVASNFASIAEALADRFEAESDHAVTLVAGSTGKLYAQIVRGAPFDVFLAADSLRPGRLVSEGRAVEGSRRVYALGRLRLWSGEMDGVAALGPERLSRGEFRHLAIANPALAPYGVAAHQVLQTLALEERLDGRLVFGENIGQTYALVASGNAELGLVAASQLVAAGASSAGWLVPRSHHAPIRQEGVLLSRAEDLEAAQAFLSFLASDDARRLIEAAGYEVP